MILNAPLERPAFFATPLIDVLACPSFIKLSTAASQIAVCALLLFYACLFGTGELLFIIKIHLLIFF